MILSFDFSNYDKYGLCFIIVLIFICIFIYTYIRESNFFTYRYLKNQFHCLTLSLKFFDNIVSHVLIHSVVNF